MILGWTIFAALTVATLAIPVLAGLKAWREWLELKRLELPERSRTSALERIEIADLRSRVRKLEAIAALVDP